MSGPREPAPLAPPEPEDVADDVPFDPTTDEATPLPPAVPYHVADPSSYSIERLLRVPDHEPPITPDDDTTIPEHLRSARMAELAGEDVEPTDGEQNLSTVPHDVLEPGLEPDEATEDEQTRPRVRLNTKG